MMKNCACCIKRLSPINSLSSTPIFFFLKEHIWTLVPEQRVKSLQKIDAILVMLSLQESSVNEGLLLVLKFPQHLLKQTRSIQPSYAIEFTNKVKMQQSFHTVSQHLNLPTNIFLALSTVTFSQSNFFSLLGKVKFHISSRLFHGN